MRPMEYIVHNWLWAYHDHTVGRLYKDSVNGYKNIRYTFKEGP